MCSICRNLDETTKSVYKENVRVNEALTYHIQAGDKLKAAEADLHAENEELKGEKELNEMIVKEKVAQARSLKQQLREVGVGILSPSQLIITL